MNTWRCIGWSLEPTDSKFCKKGQAPTPTEVVIESHKPAPLVLSDFRRSHPHLKNHRVHAADAKVIVIHRRPNNLPVTEEVALAHPPCAEGAFGVVSQEATPAISVPQESGSHPCLSRITPTDACSHIRGAAGPLTPDAPVMLSDSQSRSPRSERRPSPRENPAGSAANPSDDSHGTSCRALGVSV